MSSFTDVTPPTDLKLQVRTWWVEAMKEATDVKPGRWQHSKEEGHFSSPPDLCWMHCTSNNATDDCKLLTFPLVLLNRANAGEWMCWPHLVLKFSLQATEKQEESVKCHVLVLLPHIQRAKGVFIHSAVFCLVQTKNLKDKMKTNQSLHHLEHLASIQLQARDF